MSAEQIIYAVGDCVATSERSDWISKHLDSEHSIPLERDSIETAELIKSFKYCKQPSYFLTENEARIFAQTQAVQDDFYNVIIKAPAVFAVAVKDVKDNAALFQAARLVSAALLEYPVCNLHYDLGKSKQPHLKSFLFGKRSTALFLCAKDALYADGEYSPQTTLKNG